MSSLLDSSSAPAWVWAAGVGPNFLALIAGEHHLVGHGPVGPAPRPVPGGICAVHRCVAALPGGPPTLSIGLATLPQDSDTVEQLAAASDATLYDAEVNGRNRIASAAGAGARGWPAGPNR